MSFLKENNFDPLFSRLVKPRNAFKEIASIRKMVKRVFAAQNMNALQELVYEIEEGKRGIPPLLRHYLKLGGHILAFNIDKDFNNVLDALFMVGLWEWQPMTSSVLPQY